MRSEVKYNESRRKMKNSSRIATASSILAILPIVKKNKQASTACDIVSKIATVSSYGYALDSYSELDESDYDMVLTNVINDFIITPSKDIIFQKVLSELSRKIEKW